MTAPDAGTPDPATCVDQNIVRQVAGPLCRSGVHHSQLDFADVPCAMCVELAEFAVVALVGRLLPADAETRTEWASEHSGHGAANFPDPLIFETGSDRRLAEVRVETWRASHPPATHRLLSRQVTTTRGPWLPAPTTDTEDTP